MRTSPKQHLARSPTHKLRDGSTARLYLSERLKARLSGYWTNQFRASVTVSLNLLSKRHAKSGSGFRGKSSGERQCDEVIGSVVYRREKRRTSDCCSIVAVDIDATANGLRAATCQDSPSP